MFTPISTHVSAALISWQQLLNRRLMRRIAADEDKSGAHRETDAPPQIVSMEMMT